jgi:hypothetical protein
LKPRNSGTMNQTNRFHSKRAIINAVIQLEKRVWKAVGFRPFTWSLPKNPCSLRSASG